MTPLFSPNAFNNYFDNSTRLKMGLSCPSSLAQNDHLKQKLSLCCHFATKRGRWPPFLLVFLTHYDYNRIYIREKRNLGSNRSIF